MCTPGGVTALLAAPELPPLPAESQTNPPAPETITTEPPEEFCFAAILAALEIPPENESGDEENDETAPVALTPAADSRALWFGWFEPAAQEEPPPAKLSPVPGGAFGEPNRSDAGTDPVAAPVVFELEVQPDSPIPAAPESKSPAAESPVATSGATAEPLENGHPAAGPRETSRMTGKQAAPKEAAPAAPMRRAEEGEPQGLPPTDIAPEVAAAAPVADYARPVAAESAPPPPDNGTPAIREAAPAPERPRAIEPRRMEVRIEPSENAAAPPVDVVVSQRGAALHFSVHSADGRLGAQMKQSWGELTERLESLGYRAAPAPAAEPAPAAKEPSGAEQPWSGADGSAGSAFSGHDKRQGRRDRNQWRLAIESQSAAKQSTDERNAA